MQWVPLKKYHVHLIDREVDKIMEKHRQMRESIIQGDILSVQKISELQRSIKRRIHQIDDFYNANCFDQRVRFLQGPRMKLWRLVNNSMVVEKDKELTVNLPWKNSNQVQSAKGLNTSGKLSATPRKNQPALRSNSPDSFIRSGPVESRNKPSQSSIKKKPNITLHIPDESPYRIDDQYSNRQTQEIKIERNHPKTGRKTQYIPQKPPATHTNNSFSINPNNQPAERSNKIKANESNANQPVTSRSKVTAGSRSRALTETGNTGSMKKLNDLIFTIKMTKQEYQGFMDMKKRLDRQGH